MVHAVSRQPRADQDSVRWFQADLNDGAGLTQAARGCQSLIHLAPVWTLPTHLPSLADSGIRRLIAFSSTSRFTKQDSANTAERAIVQRLIDAEQAIQSQCAKSGIQWTLFRPTLIYGLNRDRNVADIARFIRRFHFFPIAGKGSGLRQPVHACDLARACLDALQEPASNSRDYNLSGGETLDYSEMVKRIFEAEGLSPRLLHIPLAPLRLLLRLMSLLPGYGHLNAEMADRMNRDLVYAHASASRDFGYRPREFSPHSTTSIKGK